MTCTEHDCGRPAVARGWCRRHYNQQWKQGLPALPANPNRPPHRCTDHPAGTRRCYSLCRCRCAACTRANSTYERQRQKQAAYGRPITIDATDIARRINELRQAGIGLRTIAADTGLNRGNLRRIADGTTRRVSSRVAVVIERYTPDHGRYIPVDRQLADHLAALKIRHTWAELEQATGISHATLWNLHNRRAATTPQTRNQIISTPLVCVECGQPALAGGLRCVACFQQIANPKPSRPTGCGSDAGYAAHRRAGEEPCVQCRRAHSAYSQARRSA